MISGRLKQFFEQGLEMLDGPAAVADGIFVFTL
jgi:hypothetical protein